jgi:hypothetical protein
MAQLGTGIQLAAIGPQNEFLDLNPQVTAFHHKAVKSTRFAREAIEELPLQTFGFGKTGIFEIPPSGDLLGDMFMQLHIPAVQPRLGLDLPVVADALVPPVVLAQANVAAAIQFAGVRVTLDGSPLVTCETGTQGDNTLQVWQCTTGTHAWRIVLHGSKRVETSVAALDPDPDPDSETAQTATVSVWDASTGAPIGTYAQRVGRQAAVQVHVDAATGQPALAFRNDEWRSRLGYVFMRRVRFIVDDLVIHDQERLWYDLSDQLALAEGHAAGLDDMLGVGLSMAQEHTVLVPLKFLSCKSHGNRQTFFPVILVPNCRVRVEFDAEAFSQCIPLTFVVRPTPPASLDARLVIEHITLDAEERNAMLLKPLTLMYEGSQDMDALNYTVATESAVPTTNKVSIDLSELNLPVKWLAWVVYPERVTAMFDYVDAVDSATLLIGSTERATGIGPVFARQQVWTHAKRSLPGNVYMYSFALNATAAEPSGALDFSMVQKPTLRLVLKPSHMHEQLKCKAWGATYNWLKFAGGKVSQVFTT